MLKVVVVGNGMVGHHYVDQLSKSSAEAKITVIGGETRPAYDRVHLSEYFSGRTAEDLALTTKEYYEELGVDGHFGDPVVKIDRDNKQVITESGVSFAYDKLVLATGSYPFVPPVQGNDHSHCLVYRTIDDLGDIEQKASESQVGVVVGGGLLGLECANALKNLGLDNKVLTNPNNELRNIFQKKHWQMILKRSPKKLFPMFMKNKFANHINSIIN